MTGKRLLDVAALINATRGVIEKSITLHTRELDVYGRTSTLAKAVKSQTDRVTETAKAVSFLASRLNETRPSWSADDNGAGARRSGEPSIPNNESTKERSGPRKGGIQQDQIYERSESNSVNDPAPANILNIEQEKVNRYPLPDGTIPPSPSDLQRPERDYNIGSHIPTEVTKATVTSTHKGRHSFEPAPRGTTSTISLLSKNQLSSDRAKLLQSQSERQTLSYSGNYSENPSRHSLSADHDQDTFYEPSRNSSPAVSSLPRIKLPNHTQNAQGNNEQLKREGINADTYSSPTAGQDVTPDYLRVAQAVSKQEQTSEDINTDISSNPKVAKLLGGKFGKSKKDVMLKNARHLPLEQIKPFNNDVFDVEPYSQPDLTTPVPSDANRTSADRDAIELAGEPEKSPFEKDSNSLNPSPSEFLSSSSYQMKESSVPSSRIGRIWNYGGLAAGMFGGAITEGFRRATGNGGDGSFMLSTANMDRLVVKLSRMRGAALKLGQMMSFQDSKMLPAPIQQVLLRVQDSADYMPSYQRDKVLVANLGPEWRQLFSDFEERPIAAASIGQVHKATLKSTGTPVAVKVQYPGVAESIDSDLNNLTILLTASRLLPKGLFLDRTIANARVELGWECDYIREAECGRRFHSLLANETGVFVVPKVYHEASGKQVITMEYMNGVGVTKLQELTQKQKDWIGTQILRLCLMEITEFRFMQTDPNWTNFLFNKETNKLELLDFGASREYPQGFIDTYTRLLLAASRFDKKTVGDLSLELGYLTGDESKAMLDAHISSILTLAEPFLDNSPEVYDFKDQTITDRVKAFIPVMVKERLAPPPEETYSLHRKLSGAFLLCARLGSRVRCRELFEKSMSKAGLL